MRAVRLLGLEGRVWGVAADAAMIPFRDSWFNVVAAVHSIRDFSSIEVLVAAVREMKRVVKRGGYVVLIENLPIARNEPQRNHLKLRSIRAKLFKNELGYLSKEKLLMIINEVGFKDIEVKVMDYGLCSTPAIFYIGEELVQRGVDPALIDEFRETVRALEKWGKYRPQRS